jgi:hypothetical protein
VTSIQTQASQVITCNSPYTFTTQTSPTSRLTAIPAVIVTCIGYNSNTTEQLPLLQVFQSGNSTFNILFPNYVQHPCHQHSHPNLDSTSVYPFPLHHVLELYLPANSAGSDEMFINPKKLTMAMSGFCEWMPCSQIPHIPPLCFCSCSHYRPSSCTKWKNSKHIIMLSK